MSRRHVLSFNITINKIFRLYCRYEYDRSNISNGNREDELRHFLTRMNQKNISLNKWPPPKFYSESYRCKYK